MPPKPKRGRDRFRGEDPFDLWLCGALHRQHDAAAQEEVPADLARLAADSQDEREVLRARWAALPAA